MARPMCLSANTSRKYLSGPTWSRGRTINPIRSGINELFVIYRHRLLAITVFWRGEAPFGAKASRIVLPLVMEIPRFLESALKDVGLDEYIRLVY